MKIELVKGRQSVPGNWVYRTIGDADALDEAQVLRSLHGMDKESRTAVMLVLQRLLDGRILVLQKAEDMTGDALREVRGGIQALGEAEDSLWDLFERADRDFGPARQ